MFSLPPSRKSWRCGTVWEYGQLSQTDQGCGQLIYQSNDRKYSSGKYMILNDENGPGGARDDPHVCPRRVGSKFHKINPVNMIKYNDAQRHKTCVVCATTFNGEFYPLCPTCFKLQCRRCGNLQHWINEGRESSCNGCKSTALDVRQMYFSYMRFETK